MNRFPIFILFASFVFATDHLCLTTINNEKIEDLKIIRVLEDSVYFSSGDFDSELSIDYISELKYERPYARGIASCIGLIGGFYTGVALIRETNDSNYSNKSSIYYSWQLHVLRVGGILAGSMAIFSYLGYRFTQDIIYDFDKMSKSEKMKILNKIKT